MNKFPSPLSDLILHVMMSLLLSKVEKPKLMPLKILICSEPNEAIIRQLLERFPTSPCPYLYFIVCLTSNKKRP